MSRYQLLPCPVCGNPRGSKFDHRKCSVITQQKHAADKRNRRPEYSAVRLARHIAAVEANDDKT